MLAYGIATQALRYPNAEPSWKLFKDVVYKPYWQMYGELFLEEVEDPSVVRCPEKSWLALVLFAVYMIIYTFERVQGNSEKVWRFYRYSLIYEYFDRPTLAPPLIIFSHIFRIFKYAKRTCQVLSEEENNKLTAFEHAGMENYLLQKHLTKRDLIDSKVQSTSERIDKVIVDLEQIKERIITQNEDPSTMTQNQSMTLQKTQSIYMSPRPQPGVSPMYPDSSAQVEKRLANVETQLAQCVRLLRTIAAEPKPRRSVRPQIEIEGVSGLDSHV
ncbi:hypothetical protein NP493_2235g00009 [Ridgeia piscesae]|uniref:Uncharacterized protein n=1 Tax=Ridgeia piscesae TaxID=27915 RepID=A0AAD9JJ47_RIDPI|nr:hypothetical protein NP493_2235g00009 [Ridgeia piscesae]